MENLSSNIANKIALELNMDNDKREVIAYGTFALLQTVLSIFLTITIGYLFHVAIESIIILFTVSILRKYSGGAHASSPANCTFIGIIICIGQAISMSVIANMWEKLNVITILVMIIFAWSYYIIYKLAPVDSLSKPIKRKEKKKQMKKKSFIVLTMYFTITIFMLIVYLKLKKTEFFIYVLCINSGIAWQTFTLSKRGHLFVKKIDNIFDYIIK